MEALDHVAGLTAGGYTDWRLPNAREMLSLVNFGVAGQKAWLESQGFANVQVGPLDFYWTGTTYTYLSTHAWYMDWTVGTLAPDRLKSDSLHVWAVRSQAACLPATDAGEITGYALDPREDGATRKGIALPSPRFRDNGNGTLTDNMTGLIWLQNANHANAGLQWLAALDYLQNTINGGGGTAGSADWLLPNVNELGSLFLCSQVHMYTWLAGQGFSNVPIGDIINFWSATTRNPAYHSAWFVRLSWVAVTPDSKGYSMFVWPVRRN
jgi:hypothetical protein